MHLQAGEWESLFCLPGWASNGGKRRAGEFRSEFYDVSSLGAETGPDGTELDIQKRQSEVLVFLPSLCALVLLSCLQIQGTNRRFLCWAYRPLFELYLHFQSKGIHATGSNCFTSPSTAGVASKGKLFISSNTCGSISPAIRSNYWIWASSG